MQPGSYSPPADGPERLSLFCFAEKSERAIGYTSKNQIPLNKLTAPKKAKNGWIGNHSKKLPTDQSNTTKPTSPYQLTLQIGQARHSSLCRNFVSCDSGSPSAVFNPNCVYVITNGANEPTTITKIMGTKSSGSIQFKNGTCTLQAATKSNKPQTMGTMENTRKIIIFMNDSRVLGTDRRHPHWVAGSILTPSDRKLSFSARFIKIGGRRETFVGCRCVVWHCSSGICRRFINRLLPITCNHNKQTQNIDRTYELSIWRMPCARIR